MQPQCRTETVFTDQSDPVVYSSQLTEGLSLRLWLIRMESEKKDLKSAMFSFALMRWHPKSKRHIMLINENSAAIIHMGWNG